MFVLRMHQEMPCHLLVKSCVFLRDKLNVNFHEVNLQTTIKKINKSFKVSQRTLTHINNLKTILSIRSGEHGIESIV